MDNKTTYKLTYGLFVLTAKENEKDNGCIINTAIQVTTEPNRISMAVNKANYTHDMILRTKKFTVSILSEEADFELFKRFGFQSGRDVNKFEGFNDFKRGANGIDYVTKGTNGFISAEVEQIIDLGTHSSDTPSTTYAYYQSHIKPQPQATAKTSGGKVIWRCTVCGYEYEGEELPADFICPLCKHPASDFEKVIV